MLTDDDQVGCNWWTETSGKHEFLREGSSSNSQLIGQQIPQSVFVQMAKCICPNCNMYLSKLQNVFVQIGKCICPNCKMYLSKLQNVFVQIAKYICLNGTMYLSKYKMYFSKLQNVFAQIAQCICPNHNMFLSKWLTALPVGLGPYYQVPRRDRIISWSAILLVTIEKCYT